MGAYRPYSIVGLPRYNAAHWWRSPCPQPFTPKKQRRTIWRHESKDECLALAQALPPASEPALPHPGQLLLTVPQVARLLGMTPKAIYHRAERGQSPASSG